MQLTFDSVKAFVQSLDRNQVQELQGLITEASYRQKNLDEQKVDDSAGEAKADDAEQQ